jgi:hypothetical protein
MKTMLIQIGAELYRLEKKPLFRVKNWPELDKIIDDARFDVRHLEKKEA